MIGRQPDGIKLKLCFVSVSLRVNVRRLIPLIAEKDKTVTTYSYHSWHKSSTCILPRNRPPDKCSITVIRVKVNGPWALAAGWSGGYNHRLGAV